METRRNALLLFSKVPEPGRVKTRLTPALDGWLSPEAASGLYHCMLFDVAEACCDALRDLEAESAQAAADGADVRDEYALIVSSPGIAQAGAMRALFEASGAWPRGIEFIHDDGASFDEHYNHAFSQVWERGFHTVLSMGCDMPALRRSVVIEGFRRLHELCARPGGGIVVAPDQEMGVSIVGWTAQTAFDHTGVFYATDGLTVLRAYIQKARAADLPALYLPDVPDVDTMADLRHNATLVAALEYCAQFQPDVTPPWRTANALRTLGLADVRVMPNNLRDDRTEIDR